MIMCKRMKIFTHWVPLLVCSLEQQNNCKINSFKRASITLASTIRAMGIHILEKQRSQKPQNKVEWWCNTSPGWKAWKLPEESPYIEGGVKRLKNLGSPGNDKSNRCTHTGRVKPAHMHGFFLGCFCYVCTPFSPTIPSTISASLSHPRLSHMPEGKCHGHTRNVSY